MDSFDINLDQLPGAPIFSQEPDIISTESMLGGDKLFSDPSQPNQQLIPYGHPFQFMEIDDPTFEAMIGTNWAHQEPFYGIDQQAPVDIWMSGLNGNSMPSGANTTLMGDSYDWLSSHSDNQFRLPLAVDSVIAQASQTNINDLNDSFPTTHPTMAYWSMLSAGVEPQDLSGGNGVRSMDSQSNWSPFQGFQPIAAETTFRGGQPSPVASQPEGLASAG